jgi:hypothetical protein
VYASLGTLLPFALGIAINPASIVAAILLLTSSQGHTKGLAYLFGWLIGLITLFFALVLLVNSASYKRFIISSDFASWITLLIGLTLLLMAYIQWRQRPAADAKIIPFAWLRAIPRATSYMALGAGLFFCLFDVKNLLLMAATALIIGEANLPLDSSMVVILLFVAIATTGIAAPVAVSFTQSDHNSAILADWESGLSVHNITITCTVLVVIAVQMLGLSIGSLLGG